MKPPKFDYHAPKTVDEALALLTRYDGEAKILAGGQSLMPLLNFRLSRPAALVDLNRIPALAYIKEVDGSVRFGAMTRQRAIEFSPVVARRLPLLTEATRWVGHLPIRTRGTIGGSIAHADPSAEYPAVLTALDGEVVARGPKGERVLKPRDFFQTYLTTSLAADEILTEVRLPATPAGAGYAFEEFARRHGDFAIIGIAAVIVREGSRCTMARLATAGAGPIPVRLRAAEEILEREGLGDDALARAAAKAQELVQPDGDIHASADYRRHLTGVLTGRAVKRALTKVARWICGACTILFNGEAARSCIMLAVQAEGAELRTIEGLMENGKLHPLQEAFHEHHGLQCGFCTPGMLMTALDFLRVKPEPTEAEIREGISAVLCRCTGYQGIINAVKAAAPVMRGS